jgi:hypothetical protein
MMLAGMAREAELEYAKLKDFLAFYAERYLKVESLPPETGPIACLETLEKKSMKTALREVAPSDQ